MLKILWGENNNDFYFYDSILLHFLRYNGVDFKIFQYT